MVVEVDSGKTGTLDLYDEKLTEREKEAKEKYEVCIGWSSPYAPLEVRDQMVGYYSRKLNGTCTANLNGEDSEYY
jgi:hypothetical protein